MDNRKRLHLKKNGERRLPPSRLFELGRHAGYEKGRTAGYEDFEQGFEGTSIIIPTFNKKKLLLQCLDSIEAHTPFPYELVVVDDASTDGTKEALRDRRKIRLAVHSRNLGFAGSINTGLMMAKGQTVLLLNNDVLVTENWLGNMLDCLNSSPDIGAVGPVTNYIGGEQQIEVPYLDVGDMWGFAAEHNRKNPLRWRRTDRLVGFCLLMKHETVMQTGYFDEGYRVGNYEDDDWMIRLRLQGMKLMIAGDAFIHHFGSETMKSLNEQDFAQINKDNSDYFHRKWGHVHERLGQIEQLRENGRTAQTLAWSEGSPAQVLARSGSGTLYWLDHGMRYRIKDADAATVAEIDPSACAIRLSQRSLRNIPLGGEWGLREARAAIAKASVPGEPLGEGSVVSLDDGQMYQIDRGAARNIWTRYTAEAWGLADRARPISPGELAAFPAGPPVLPPIQLISPLL
ncbi:glycosyltransferase family 2 protein [Paenibacillus caui]|uniref:glycosyltransferase family 2 protein n=1 Tax=Paenibacillus caui TaxID=2873927 RepID=UPI001CA8292A|nr:glycosyltransferase family 2 protein [Paenibacillus caui]